MTVGQLSFKILPLLLLFCMNYPPITCQNCGIPSTIRVSDQLAESLDTGQLIIKPPIPAYNVVNILKITNNPDGFAEVELAREVTPPNLMVKVAKPLWHWRDNNISFIDKSRLHELNIIVELECSDGGHRNLPIIVSIIDENTSMPKYEQEHYDLTTEPCMLEKCALIFERDIIVIDKDRDKENAQVFVWTDEPSISFLPGFSAIEPWYEEGEDGLLDKGYQSRVKLEYTPDKRMTTWRNSISFKIYVNNTVKPADGTVFCGVSTITINFVEKQRMLPPVFTSSLYYAVVNYAGEQVSTLPRNIYASAPGEEEGKDSIGSTIKYLITGDPDMFYIDCKGELSFIKDIGVRQIVDSLKISKKYYNVTAIRQRTTGEEETTNSTVPLVVFFVKDDEWCPTPKPPVCECEPSPTPWPGTCPTPTCPVPEPCPEIPTTFPSTTTPTTTITTTKSTTTPTTTAKTTTTPTTITTTKSTTPPTTITMPPTSVLPTVPSTSGATDPSTPTTSEWTYPTTTSTPEVTYSTEPFPTDPPEVTDPSTTPPGDTNPPTTTFIPTTTDIPTTLPPIECSCDCTNFSCDAPQVQPGLNSTHFNYYRDPYNCTIYHRCANSESGPIDEGNHNHTFECPPGKVFCPPTSACMTLEMCIARTFPNISFGGATGKGHGVGMGYGEYDSEEEECKECQCRVGVLPGESGNLCTRENHLTHIPDPNYCDVFHQCVEISPGAESYIDYPMRCPAGLVFCPSIDACYYPFGECACKDRIFKQCDVCIMGFWPDFDIFKKKFNDDDDFV